MSDNKNDHVALQEEEDEILKEKKEVDKKLNAAAERVKELEQALKDQKLLMPSRMPTFFQKEQ